MINRNYRNLQDSYLFSTIARRVKEYQEKNPEARIIRLGIGDVTRPLCAAVVGAMHAAVDEMAVKETFRGYGPEQGYDFLKGAVCTYYGERGITVAPEEIFVGDGAKSDLANILDIFGTDTTVLIPDPVYPVYLDTNIMAGRRILFMDARRQNGFLPTPEPSSEADIIYLCSPNNPTGAVYTHELLQKWVDYAVARGAVILFDAAYESFIADTSLPRSIFEIDGAQSCAVEFCSLSKTAGFTGTRCGWTVVPQQLTFEGTSLNRMWLRRQTTKFNGVSYVVQRGAAAVFTPEGQTQVRADIGYYMENARIIAGALDRLGIAYTGGVNSPYIWMACPDNMPSWDFFDLLLQKAGVVGTPGAGFGKNGEGYFRLTAFGDRNNTIEAMERMESLF